MIETNLVQLPNGDLHRGVRFDLQNVDVNVEVIPAEHAHPLNKAMAQILTAAKGSKELTCLWCGLQFGGQFGEQAMRTHLQTDHKNVVVPTADAAILMANLAEAQKKLAEAESVKE